MSAELTEWDVPTLLEAMGFDPTACAPNANVLEERGSTAHKLRCQARRIAYLAADAIMESIAGRALVHDVNVADEARYWMSALGIEGAKIYHHAWDGKIEDRRSGSISTHTADEFLRKWREK